MKIYSLLDCKQPGLPSSGASARHIREAVKLYTLALCIYCLGAPAAAQNKVVVIPLGGDLPSVRIFYGSVNRFGTLESGNIQSSSRTAEGRYTLETGQSTAGCAITATKGAQAGGSYSIYGNINASVPGATGTYFTIRARNSMGALDDTDFHFNAICPL